MGLRLLRWLARGAASARSPTPGRVPVARSPGATTPAAAAAIAGVSRARTRA